MIMIKHQAIWHLAKKSMGKFGSPEANSILNFCKCLSQH